MRVTEANRKWWVLGAMTLSLSIVLIDQTVVGVALPAIQRDLDTSQTELQWVVNAYLLALAVFVAICGRLGDMRGHGLLFKLGGLVFVAASAVCGLATSDTMLLAARAAQGIGAALMVPASGALVINAFEPQQRGRAMGIYAGISMIFLAMGPLVGGALTDWVTWRAVFFINLPLGLVMILLAQISLRPENPDRSQRMDWAGFFLIAVGVAALVLGLMQSEVWGWGSPATIALLAIGGVLLPLAVVVELRAKYPLIEFRLFRSRNFTADTIVLTLTEFALIGLTIFGSLWVQDVLGFSPILAGVSLLPALLPLIVIAPLTGRSTTESGPAGWSAWVRCSWRPP
jgi:EmrB/QacA subfamily drug resistance transporter